MVTAVEALGVKRDDVQTRQITLARIGYGPNRGRFEANNLIEVRVATSTKQTSPSPPLPRQARTSFPAPI